MKAHVIINDLHLPAHDPAALDICLKATDILFGEGLLSEIILNGDIADFWNIKFHAMAPHEFGIKTRLKDEIWLVNKFLEHLQCRYPGIKITFIEGNHCQRLARYMIKNAPEAFELMSVPELFKLEERKIPFIPYGRNQLYQVGKTDLYVRHSPYSYSIHCAYACLTKKFINLIFGCTHRYQEVKLKDAAGNEKYACSNACLIDFDHPMFGYMDTDNWAKGFSVAWTEGQWWENQHVKIKGGRSRFEGWTIKGSKKFDFTR